MADQPTPDFDPDRPDLAFAGGSPSGPSPLLRLLFVNWLIGAAVAVVLFAAVMITDTAHLRTLIMSSSEPWIPMLLLFIGFLITMCSVAMGTAVMLLPSDDDDDRGSGGGTPLEVLRLPKIGRALAPAPVRAEASHRPHRHR